MTTTEHPGACAQEKTPPPQWEAHVLPRRVAPFSPQLEKALTQQGFPDDSAGKESTCNAGNPGLIPRLGRSTGEMLGYPLVFLAFPGSSDGKESAWNVGDLDLIPGLGRFPGEGKGYPLQYSGMENFMGCIVHGVTKSWTQLRDFHSLTHLHTKEDLAQPKIK